MSFDFYFRPRAQAITDAEVIDYFNARPNYSIIKGQAFYKNEDTGVYFTFYLEDDEPALDEVPSGIMLNVNFLRPGYFMCEAEIEAQAFVRHFGWTVFDPQTNGMGEGEYQGGGLISSYNASNRTAYSVMLREAPSVSEELQALPADTLMRIWRWNWGRRQLQAEVGEGKFVPCVVFALLDGKLSSVAVWADAIAAELPIVDYFLIARDKLAPRRFFRKKPDLACLAWSDAIALLERHGSRRQDGGISLGYDAPPRDVIDTIAALAPNERTIAGVPPDKVLDRELVENALATG